MGLQYFYAFEAKEIQRFILQSDKLKEMLGGSEIVARLCDDFLKDALQQLGLDGRHEMIANAAGWARILFYDEDAMATFFAHWPFLAEQFAPGLQMIQAVTEIADKSELPEAIYLVGRQLRRERNLALRTLPEITPLIERNPRTGLAAVEITDAGREADNQSKLRDRQAKRKHDHSDGMTVAGAIDIGVGLHWPTKFDDIVAIDNAYLAIIHADGNDLGSTLMCLKEHVKKPGVDAAEVYQRFTYVIDSATKAAVKSAFDVVLRPAAEVREGQMKGMIPARPIVLGGDDLTIVVRADLAFAFTKAFLQAFEEESTTLLKNKMGTVEDLPTRLTACAGIAFVKKAYPFAHGYELSESLCAYAKLLAKENKYRLENGETKYVPSSFAFHRNTSSIAGDFGEIREQELTSRDRKVKLWFGPYAIGEQTGNLPSFVQLEALSRSLARLPGGSVRELIGELYLDSILAQTRFARMLEVAPHDRREALKSALRTLIPGTPPAILDTRRQTPLLDAHTLAGLTGMTKEEHDDQG